MGLRGAAAPSHKVDSWRAGRMPPLPKITVSTHAQAAESCPVVKHSTTSFFDLDAFESLHEFSGRDEPICKNEGQKGACHCGQ